MIKSLAWSSNILDGVKSSFVAVIRFFLRNADILAKQHCQVPIKTLIFDSGKKRKVRAISLHNCLRFPIYTLQQLKGHAGSLFRIDVCRIGFAAFLGICRSARLLRDLLIMSTEQWLISWIIKHQSHWLSWMEIKDIEHSEKQKQEIYLQIIIQ